MESYIVTRKTEDKKNRDFTRQGTNVEVFGARYDWAKPYAPKLNLSKPYVALLTLAAWARLLWSDDLMNLLTAIAATVLAVILATSVKQLGSFPVSWTGGYAERIDNLLSGLNHKLVEESEVERLINSINQSDASVESPKLDREFDESLRYLETA